MKKLWALPVLLLTVFLPLMAYAQDASLPLTDWLSQALDVVKTLMAGNVGWALKVSGVIVLIVASMKVSFLNDMVWSKLGSFQKWLAPTLGLAAGVISAFMGGSWSAVLPYLAAGMGAMYLHELLDMVKLIPGLGSVWVKVIDFIETWAGGPAAGKSTARKS